MDKLKPLIQHHFWILFGLVLILPIVGWMPAVSQYSQQTLEKIGKIDQAFSGVPSGPQANDSWSKALNKKAEAAEEKNLDARYGLWKRQEAMMLWPNTIKKDLQPKSYREEISPIARNIYKNNYSVQVRSVWQKVDPFDVTNGKGTVIFPLEGMPRATFGELTPNSEELWNAQEDLWLVESLLKSIRRANSQASLITESLVRSIKTLKLVGGPGDYPQAEPTGGGMEGFGDDGGGMTMEFDPAMGPDGMGMGGRGPAVSAGSVSFNPADEFGEEQGRYIDFKEGTIFKKRGFYMEAVIDHQRLPELLTILSNNSWPVTITRVQMAQASLAGTSLLGGGNAGMMDSGVTAPYGAGGMNSGSFDPVMSDPALLASGAGGAAGFATLAKAAEFGPQLAVVAISGVIHIYNPPENLADLQQKATAAAAAAATLPAEPDPGIMPAGPDATDLPPVGDLPPAIPDGLDDLGPPVPGDDLAPMNETPATVTPATETPAAPAADSAVPGETSTPEGTDALEPAAP